MLTISEKHSYDNQIAELKEELSKVRDELRKARNSRNEWKCKYRKAVGEKFTSASRARIMIAQSKEKGFTGSVVKECARIGKVIGVTGGTVANHWYEKAPFK